MSEVQVGDWVRFMRHGTRLVIGEVVYILADESIFKIRTLVTTVGSIEEAEVMEVRRETTKWDEVQGGR